MPFYVNVSLLGKVMRNLLLMGINHNAVTSRSLTNFNRDQYVGDTD